MSEIKAITFDLWDTVFHDDSDEPKREAAGLPPKAEQRRRLVHEFLSRHSETPRNLVDIAYATADAAFRRVWKEHHITWTVEKRLEVLLQGLDRELPPEEMSELVRSHEDMEVEISPDLIPGAVDTIKELSRDYPLAVISDAIFTPGRGLRKMLERAGILDCFAGFSFSDEIGRSKPHPLMFEAACDQLGVGIQEIVHIGDRDHNDIKGPQALGARGILFTATRDADRNDTSADAICEDYRQLPGLIRGL